MMLTVITISRRVNPREELFCAYLWEMVFIDRPVYLMINMRVLDAKWAKRPKIQNKPSAFTPV
jgi:hypothetical protein